MSGEAPFGIAGKPCLRLLPVLTVAHGAVLTGGRVHELD
jgi:hypothetical protein